ncbi:MAG: methyl-accepting chemotaxis protein [Candidatus Methanoperedens sp.]|nr:MAG: methyl-accepting chemotaxis protein [Candidatus Methanoperedens sp.]
MNQQQPGLDDLITPEEREHLLYGLHRFLVWVGEKLPDKVEVDGKDIEIHDLIWRCIHKNKFSEQEKQRFMELVRMLEAKEKLDEQSLQKASLTREDAIRLYHESAALIRAIMDLRECEAGKVRLKETDVEIKHKIDDAKRWIGFLKGIGKKG